LPEEVRGQARAQGVFDSFAPDAIENIVTLFETFARAQFEERVRAHEQILKKESQNVFQRVGCKFGSACKSAYCRGGPEFWHPTG